MQLPDRLGLELPFEITANGLKLAENRRARGVKMFEKDVGGASLKLIYFYITGSLLVYKIIPMCRGAGR